ncbi:hypothetical protein [Nonomuraea sp. SYSU D8015]|uniref:hypothetical protein n=1 Tax=Nonomuraea sp. SYSU D8015 TaxID=2593644 RepID=UPI00166035D5|nr:hypothetical protein [Nonomuraea sp. SYSU D8015]
MNPRGYESTDAVRDARHIRDYLGAEWDVTVDALTLLPKIPEGETAEHLYALAFCYEAGENVYQVRYGPLERPRDHMLLYSKSGQADVMAHYLERMESYVNSPEGGI